MLFKYFHKVQIFTTKTIKRGQLETFPLNILIWISPRGNVSPSLK